DIIFVERVVFPVNETPNFEGSSRFVFLQAGLTPRWDAVSGTGELGEEHSATQLGVCLGQGALSLSITPFVTGCSWDHWSAPGRSTKHGAGAPLAEGGALTAAYFHLRRRVLTAQTLSTVLDRAASTNRIYASEPTLLDAARTDGRTTVAFLRAAPGHEGATRLSLPLGDQLLNTTEIPVPADALRMMPLHWPLAGGWVHSLSMEPILYTVVAGRHLLVLLNETGGEIVLSRDFRPRHNRGAVHTERTDAEISVRFEPTRLASLLFAGPEGPFQLLTLEPRLAERVWPLDDSVYETETFPPAWVPDPEEPARGLVIGPDLVVPTAEGGYRYSVSGRGFGYRWGPWRGSDPHTWLAPISWSGPEPVTTPELIYRTSRPGMVEASPDYDDSGWRVIPSGASLAMEVHGIYRGFVWYRGHFSGESSGVTLTFRHACDLFLNGQHIASLNAPPYDLEGEPVPQRLPLPPRLLSENNVLTALVESQGHATDFDRVAQGHGLLTCSLGGGVSLHWRIRAGLSGERRVQGFTGFADWRLVPENGSPHVTWHRLTFDWELPDVLEAALFLVVERTPAQAQIYLNNQLVGRCQAGGDNQVRFWLPDGILQGGVNELLVAQWTRGASPNLGSLRLEMGTPLQHRTALV
ncbi:MAG: beta galactosidase jelly roll domain-containing protein, partial [Anaerolineae bacterium]